MSLAIFDGIKRVELFRKSRAKRQGVSKSDVALIGDRVQIDEVDGGLKQNEQLSTFVHRCRTLNVRELGCSAERRGECEEPFGWIFEHLPESRGFQRAVFAAVFAAVSVLLLRLFRQVGPHTWALLLRIRNMAVFVVMKMGISVPHSGQYRESIGHAYVTLGHHASTSLLRSTGRGDNPAPSCTLDPAGAPELHPCIARFFPTGQSYPVTLRDSVNTGVLCPSNDDHG